MAAVNRACWVKNVFGAPAPMKFPGKFQAGATAPVKIGEIIVLSSGNWIPLSSDTSMSGTIAISDCEIVSGDLAGFHNIIVPRPGDVFEFPLDAAATATATTALYYSTSQILTPTAGTNIIGYMQDEAAYPLQGFVRGGSLTDASTTVLSRGVIRMVFKASVSYFAALNP